MTNDEKGKIEHVFLLSRSILANSFVVSPFKRKTVWANTMKGTCEQDTLVERETNNANVATQLMLSRETFNDLGWSGLLVDNELLCIQIEE